MLGDTLRLCNVSHFPISFHSQLISKAWFSFEYMGTSCIFKGLWQSSPWVCLDSGGSIIYGRWGYCRSNDSWRELEWALGTSSSLFMGREGGLCWAPVGPVCSFTTKSLELQSGVRAARSVALRAISNPDPNPMSSLELTDWILSSSTHCSHSQRKAQLTNSVGGPWFWHRCWGLLPMVHPGVAWNESCSGPTRLSWRPDGWTQGGSHS